MTALLKSGNRLGGGVPLRKTFVQKGSQTAPQPGPLALLGPVHASPQPMEYSLGIAIYKLADFIHKGLAVSRPETSDYIRSYTIANQRSIRKLGTCVNRP